MFKKFYDNRELFIKAISCFAELDCLCALGELSSYRGMNMPKVTESETPYMDLVEMTHPCVQM
jgi:DNA mismatch repair ATPase MutS